MQAVQRKDNSLERASDDLKKDLEILRNAVKQRSVELALKNKEYILQNMNDMISIEIRNDQQIMNEIYTMIDKCIQESENIEQHNNEIMNQLHFHQQDDPFPSSNFEGIFQEFDTNEVTSSDMMSTLNSLLIQDRDDDLFPSSSFEGMIEDIVHQHTNTTSTIHSHTPTLDFSFIYQILQQQGYTNIQYLTSCGFGHVYKACINDQSVALKMILWPPTDTAGLQRALIEAMNMARLFHPNVVQVRSAKPLRQVSAMFIEMELMKGSFNSLMISKEIRVSEKMLIEIMRQVCGMLVWMQQHNIVPIDNILIKELDLENEEIHIAISDFGLAKASDHTNNSSLAGTYLFLAPELENEFLLPESRTSRFSVASDMFAVGVTLYQLLTFDKLTSLATLAKQEIDMFQLLSKKLNGQYSQYLVKIITSMLHLKPSERISPNKVIDTLNHPPSTTDASLSNSMTEDLSHYFFNKYERMEHVFPSSSIANTIYKVTRINNNQEQALKIINISTGKDLEFAMNQAKLMAMSHPNIVRVFEVFAPNCSKACIEMEFMQGHLQREFFSQHNVALSESVLRQVMYQVCDALVYYSETLGGASHGNIKPENILIKKVNLEHGTIQIAMTDFGKDVSLNNNNKYLAPELLNDSKPSSSSDIFALGMCMYQLMTSSIEKEEDDSKLNVVDHLLDLFSNLHHVCYSKNMLELVVSMLHSNPSQRPSLQQIMSVLK